MLSENYEKFYQYIKLWKKKSVGSALSDQDDLIEFQFIKIKKKVQLIGRIQQPHLEQLWKIKAEGKVKFYVWLLLQSRNWTADRLGARN